MALLLDRLHLLVSASGDSGEASSDARMTILTI